MMRLEDIEEILSNRFPSGFSKLSELPQPNLLKDSKKASIRISEAIQNREKISIIGDYDVDGVISSSIIYLFFQEFGIEVDVIIPNRFKDGYGITPNLLKRVNADLVITVDNGIHGFESAKILKERGSDLIITDHHNPSDTLPDAFAIVNPKQKDCKYPEKDICGAQVIWLLLAEVKKVIKSNINMSQYIDLLAIAIIADVMPITKFNHSIVKLGLKQIMQNNRFSNQIFITRLFSQKSKISSEDIAFQISPRLNSSGRMDDAIHSFKFITSKNMLEASENFEKIDNFNSDRKSIERDISKSAENQVDNSKPIILYHNENLHEGVIGIVASRIVDKFQKPAFIFSLKNGIIKGSGRSIGNIDIFQLLKYSKDILLKWGGHKMAGGVSLKIENFKQFQQQSFEFMSRYSDNDFIEESKIFGEIKLNDLSKDLIFTLNKFEPYGEMNPKPIFQLIDATVIKSFRIGKEKQFQKLLVEKDFEKREVLIFQDISDILINEKISFSYRPNLSIFNNRETIQAMFINFLDRN